MKKNNTILFYDTNAKKFIDDTVDVDMHSIYQEFLPLIESNSHILDAGCGSGRDSKYFIDNGYSVTAFDASEKLADSASKLLGQKVEQCLFQNYQSANFFDAIWACASLLHVPSNEISPTFNNLSKLLKSHGVFYCSFKYGNEDITRNGRDFTNADEKRLLAFIKGTGLSIKKTWITADVRPERQNEKWLNAILIKA